MTRDEKIAAINASINDPTNPSQPANLRKIMVAVLTGSMDTIADDKIDIMYNALFPGV